MEQIIPVKKDITVWTVPVDKDLLIRTVPVNKSLLTGTFEVDDSLWKGWESTQTLEIVQNFLFNYVIH